MIRVLVADDHKLLREGVSKLLGGIKGITIVGEACDGEDALKQIRLLQPDVVLMDINMPGIDGLEATRRALRIHPNLKVVALSIYEGEPYTTRMLQAGAAGYLTKTTDVEEMVRAIRRAYSGQRYVSAEIAQRLALRPYTEDDGSPFDNLSSRESQIALMVINGNKVSEISDKLALSPKTVNSYRYRIFDKLSVVNDVTLTKLAIKYGVIDSEAMI